ncbi:MAG: hypothetical protein NVS9B1_21350 [Candidatus Dormibacteraceae bacterium]
MIGAATRLFAERGYGATTMADIAAEAGVAVQSMYFTFHTKFAVLQEAFDVAVVGSDDFRAPNQQPWFEAVRDATDLGDALAVLVAHVTLISRRVAPLGEALRALGNDPAAEAFYGDRERRRHQGFGEILDVLATKRDLRPGLPREVAVDAFFALLSPELYRALVVGRGWSEAVWGVWITRTLEETLFSPAMN